ncbi:LADA_0G08152g1_1 [Lachancea dasiensis]|uniref:Endopolyphosphatase n=1 Tax=Lachancea dasiensis TaxID=1072105 RepID=A0A1G4JU33_9SACH|nr:LADA_0G08152g1_1 [Lachancea dasiensis]
MLNEQSKETWKLKPRAGAAKSLMYVVVMILFLTSFWNKSGNLWSRFFMKSSPINYQRIVVEDALQTATADELAALGLSRDSPVKILHLPNGKSKTLHGRFLHITDIHPDPLYEVGSSASEMCHRGKPDRKNDFATKFGVAMNGCDSSMELMEHTLKWIYDNLRDEIDFVVWTGDNIRHDNDRKNPRTESQIFDLNAQMAQKFEKMFRNPNSIDPRNFDVDVVPSLGNNDVFPHNLFSLGPTLQTREIYNMWGNFIPQEQQRAFARGTSFFVEVIPGKLAILSIQTLYLYKANPLVDTCDSKKEPGYQLLLWLGYVLEELRSRNMKVWLTGHVPPLEKNYDGNCFHKFTLWTNEYRDIIIGGLYGHMNMDHFVPVDRKRSWKAVTGSKKASGKALVGDTADDSLGVLDSAVEASGLRIMGAKPVNKEAYMNTVREMYYKKIASRLGVRMNKKGKKGRTDRKSGNGDRYSIVNVAGSVIPTFNPAFRVWEYNISGLDVEYQSKDFQSQGWGAFFEELEIKMERDLQEDNIFSGWRRTFSDSRRTDKTIPRKMPSDLALGPAYTPQLFSPTRFIQYYADLASIEKKYKKALKNGLGEEEAAVEAFSYGIEYCSDDQPYAMKSLLTKDYIDLAVKLADNDKLWEKFTERAFISTDYTD